MIRAKERVGSDKTVGEMRRDGGLNQKKSFPLKRPREKSVPLEPGIA